MTLEPAGLVAVAQANVRQLFDGATPEQVGAVTKLMALATFIREHCRAVMMDGHGPWLEVAEEMEAGAQLCRDQYVVAAERELHRQLLEEQERNSPHRE